MPNENEIPILKKQETTPVEVVNLEAFRSILASVGGDKVKIGKTELSKDEIKTILKESGKSQVNTVQKQIEKTEELIETVKDQKETQEKEAEKATEVGKKTHTEVKKLNENLKTSHKEIKGLGSKVEKHKQILSDNFKEGIKNTILGPWRLLITPLQSLFKTDFEEKIGEGFNKAKEKIFGKFKQKNAPSESDLSKTESGQAMLWYAKHQEKELKKGEDKGVIGNIVKGLVGTTAGATIAGSLMKGGLGLKTLFKGFTFPWEKLEKVPKTSIQQEGRLFRNAGGKFVTKEAFELEKSTISKIATKNLGKILGRGFIITNIIMSLFDVVGDAFKGFGKSKEFGASKGASVIGAALGGTNKGLVNVFGQMGKWAGIGAIAGSFIPGVGTIVGGLIGAGVGGLIGAIGGKNIAKGLDKLGKVFSGLIGSAWNFVIKMIPGASEIDKILKSDMNFGAKLSRLVIFAGSNILKLIGDIITLKPIRQLIGAVGSKLVEGVSNLIKNFSKIDWKEVQKDIGEWFSKVFTNLGAAGDFIGDKILRPIGDMFITFFKDIFENLYLQVAPIFTAGGITSLIKGGGFEGKAYQTEKSKYIEGYKAKKLDELKKSHDQELAPLLFAYKNAKKSEKEAIGIKIKESNDNFEKESNRLKSLGGIGQMATGGVALTPGLISVAENEPELIIPKSKIEKGFDNKYVQEMFDNRDKNLNNGDQKQLLLYTKMMLEEMKNLSKTMSKKDYNNIIMNNNVSQFNPAYLEVDKNLKHPVYAARGVL